MDAVHINCVRFFVTNSRMIKFYTVSELISAEIPILVKILVTIKARYSVRKFSSTSNAADNVFVPMQKNPDYIHLSMSLNLTSEGNMNSISNGSTERAKSDIASPHL